MMISRKMANRLNKQIKNEFYSAWLYRAMAYTLESMGLPVFAKWFFIQASEETEHAEKIAKYVLEQDAEVALESIPKPEGDFSTVKKIVQAALDHELLVTKQVNEIMDMAIRENDHATRSFINWFVDEQVEEVASVRELFDMVKHAKEHGQLLMLEGRVWRLVEARK